MNVDLKPCPMCDGYAVVREDRQDPDDFMYPSTYYYVECAYSTCEVRTRSYESEGQAIEGWNRRTFDVTLCPVHKRVEELGHLNLDCGRCLACSLLSRHDPAGQDIWKCCFCQELINPDDGCFLSRDQGETLATCTSCWIGITSKETE